MIITTHVIATISLGKLLGIQRFSDWFLAFLFGVLVDLDHLKIFRSRHRGNGDWMRFFNRELPVRTFLQEPISILWIVPLSFYLKNPVPMIFWSLHVFMDYLVDGCKKPFWPISNFTLKEGMLPANSFYEFLLIPVTFLLFFSKVI